MGSEPKVIKHLLVDLDGTLYRSAKLFDDVRENIEGESILSSFEHSRSPSSCVALKREPSTPPFAISNVSTSALSLCVCVCVCDKMR